MTESLGGQMETDFLVTIGKSLIQHGYYNNRIYLIQVHPDDIELILHRINYLQLVYSYEKIILKVPRSLERDFKTQDTRIEARIPGYYQGIEDALFLSRFFHIRRAEEDGFNKIQRNIHTCQNNLLPPVQKNYSQEIRIRKANTSDISELCALYKMVFETYPFPICEPYYLKKIMSSGVPFFVAETSNEVIGAGSCEIDAHASAVEMSDLAVNPKYRGYGISKMLLSFMEKHMKENHVKTAFTICRAEPLQINRLFAGFGYQHGGTLIKNTNICGKFESMNIWYKSLT